MAIHRYRPNYHLSSYIIFNCYRIQCVVNTKLNKKTNLKYSESFIATTFVKNTQTRVIRSYVLCERIISCVHCKLLQASSCCHGNRITSCCDWLASLTSSAAYDLVDGRLVYDINTSSSLNQT